MTRSCPDPDMTDAEWEVFKEEERYESPAEPEPSAWDRLADRLEDAREARMLAALAERARGVTVEEGES